MFVTGLWLVVGSLLMRGDVGKNGRAVKIGSTYGDIRDDNVGGLEAVTRKAPAHVQSHS